MFSPFGGNNLYSDRGDEKQMIISTIVLGVLVIVVVGSFIVARSRNTTAVALLVGGEIEEA